MPSKINSTLINNVVGGGADLGALTTAPSSANTDGGYKLVVLSSDPATKYEGYIYIIKAAAE